MAKNFRYDYIIENLEYYNRIGDEHRKRKHLNESKKKDVDELMMGTVQMKGDEPEANDDYDYEDSEEERHRKRDEEESNNGKKLTLIKKKNSNSTKKKKVTKKDNSKKQKAITDDKKKDNKKSKKVVKKENEATDAGDIPSSNVSTIDKVDTINAIPMDVYPLGKNVRKKKKKDYLD